MTEGGQEDVVSAMDEEQTAVTVEAGNAATTLAGEGGEAVGKGQEAKTKSPPGSPGRKETVRLLHPQHCSP